MLSESSDRGFIQLGLSMTGLGKYVFQGLRLFVHDVPEGQERHVYILLILHQIRKFHTSNFTFIICSLISPFSIHPKPMQGKAFSLVRAHPEQAACLLTTPPLLQPSPRIFYSRQFL
jgi:hypothetical protein